MDSDFYAVMSSSQRRMHVVFRLLLHCDGPAEGCVGVTYHLRRTPACPSYGPRVPWGFIKLRFVHSIITGKEIVGKRHQSLYASVLSRLRCASRTLAAVSSGVEAQVQMIIAPVEFVSGVHSVHHWLQRSYDARTLVCGQNISPDAKYGRRGRSCSPPGVVRFS